MTNLPCIFLNTPTLYTLAVGACKCVHCGLNWYLSNICNAQTPHHFPMNFSTPRTIVSVSQLTARIKESLEGLFPRLEVQGEVSNFKCQSSGHLYFSIKDSSSQIPVVMFRSRAVSLARQPRDGDRVIITGSISVYAPRGYYQLLAEGLRFSGVGDLLLLVEQLKQKLAALGWFDQERKVPLPHLPKKIGVITSPTGAVIRDILHVLERRFSGYEVLICPVRVQGENAAGEIATALATLDRFHLVDAIIIARGGGSIEDLMPFNSEQVVKAVCECTIPIISAVGHETDTTLCDLAADLRAPTPSAAAELIVPEKRALREDLGQIRRALEKPLRMHLRSRRQMLSTLAKHPVVADPQRALAFHWQRLDDLREQIAQCASAQSLTRKVHLQRLRQLHAAQTPQRRLAEKRETVRRMLADLEAKLRMQRTALGHQLSQMKRALDRSIYKILISARECWSALNADRRVNAQWIGHACQYSQRLVELRRLLEARNPKALTKKGYAIVFPRSSSEGLDPAVPISTVACARKAKELSLQLSDGVIDALIHNEGN